jgi:hypothetical protein
MSKKIFFIAISLIVNSLVFAAPNLESRIVIGEIISVNDKDGVAIVKTQNGNKQTVKFENILNKDKKIQAGVHIQFHEQIRHGR